MITRYLAKDRPFITSRNSIRIVVDLLEDMRTIARAHDRSLNGEIITALRDYVTRHKRARAKAEDA